jgi:hypothetical protein
VFLSFFSLFNDGDDRHRDGHDGDHDHDNDDHHVDYVCSHSHDEIHHNDDNNDRHTFLDLDSPQLGNKLLLELQRNER